MKSSFRNPFFFLFLWLFFFYQIIPVNASSSINLYFEPSLLEKNINSEFLLRLKINTNGNYFISGDIFIRFSNNLIEVTDIDASPSFSDIYGTKRPISTAWDNLNGQIKYTVYATDFKTGIFEPAIITFKTKNIGTGVISYDASKTIIYGKTSQDSGGEKLSINQNPVTFFVASSLTASLTPTISPPDNNNSSNSSNDTNDSTNNNNTSSNNNTSTSNNNSGNNTVRDSNQETGRGGGSFLQDFVSGLGTDILKPITEPIQTIFVKKKPPLSGLKEGEEKTEGPEEIDNNAYDDQETIVKDKKTYLFKYFFVSLLISLFLVGIVVFYKKIKLDRFFNAG